MFRSKARTKEFQGRRFFSILARELLNTMINWVVVEEEDRRQDGWHPFIKHDGSFRNGENRMDERRGSTQ